MWRQPQKINQRCRGAAKCGTGALLMAVRAPAVTGLEAHPIFSSEGDRSGRSSGLSSSLIATCDGSTPEGTGDPGIGELAGEVAPLVASRSICIAACRLWASLSARVEGDKLLKSCATGPLCCSLTGTRGAP